MFFWYQLWLIFVFFFAFSLHYCHRLQLLQWISAMQYWPLNQALIALRLETWTQQMGYVMSKTFIFFLASFFPSCFTFFYEAIIAPYIFLLQRGTLYSWLCIVPLYVKVPVNYWKVVTFCFTSFVVFHHVIIHIFNSSPRLVFLDQAITAISMSGKCVFKLFTHVIYYQVYGEGKRAADYT